MSEGSFSDLLKNSGNAPESNESDESNDSGKHVATMNSPVTPVPAIINTAYVEREEKAEDEYDEVRDGANAGERREVTRGFVTKAHLDPARQADPHGVYLDDQRRRDAETVRAQVEDREPDYDNPPYTTGDVVVDVETAKSSALPGAVVVAEKELPVIIGDHYPEDDGDEDNDE